MRYSRTQSVEGDRYITSTAVASVEVLKIIMCFALLFCELGFNLVHVVDSIKNEVFGRPIETLKVAVPSFFYTIQNNFLYIALNNLDAATYQVTYQLKILTTAIFSVIMLKRRLHCIQWVALIFLTMGVALIQFPVDTESNIELSFDVASPQFIGLVAILLACFSSGFSGVYFEKILKGTEKSIWIRNLQLSLFGTVFAFFGVLANDSVAVQKSGFFRGYNSITWIVIVLQAFGGLVVALVIKYADNVLKGFAASLSIILSALCSYYWLGDFVPGKLFIIGTVIVIISTVMYGSSQFYENVTERLCRHYRHTYP